MNFTIVTHFDVNVPKAGIVLLVVSILSGDVLVDDFDFLLKR